MSVPCYLLLKCNLTLSTDEVHKCYCQLASFAVLSWMYYTKIKIDNKIAGWEVTFGLMIPYCNLSTAHNINGVTSNMQQFSYSIQFHFNVAVDFKFDFFQVNNKILMYGCAIVLKHPWDKGSNN
jgi:hypothetical protein